MNKEGTNCIGKRKIFGVLLIIAAFLSFCYCKPRPEEGVPLHEEEYKGGVITKTVFFAEYLYDKIPKSDSFKDLAAKAYDVSVNLPIVGQAVVVRDKVREMAKSLDQMIVPITTVSTTTVSTTTVHIKFQDYD